MDAHPFQLRKSVIFFSSLALIALAVLWAAAASAATTIGNNVSAGGTLTVTGAVTLNGVAVIGDASSDTVTITARLGDDLDPRANNVIDFGAFDLAYNEIFASGTAYLGHVSTTLGLTVDGHTTLGNPATADTLTVTARLAADLDPNANNTIDFGAFDLAYNEIFASGTAYLEHVSTTYGLTVDGNTTLGNLATADTLTVTARLAADLDPNANNTIDFGAFALAYNDLFASGTVYTGDMKVYHPTASSTIYLQSGSASFGGGVIVKDADGSGCTEISASNGVAYAKIATCP